MLISAGFSRSSQNKYGIPGTENEESITVYGIPGTENDSSIMVQNKFRIKNEGFL
jgi:hypothetical protein